MKHHETMRQQNHYNISSDQSASKSNKNKPTSVDVNDVMQQLGIEAIQQQFSKHKEIRKAENMEQKSTDKNITSLSVLDQLSLLMSEIDFQAKFKEQTKEEHLPVYTVKGGNLKIPQRVYAVLIIEAILNIAKAHNIDICRHYDDNMGIAYIFNGKYWETIDNNKIKDVLTKCAIKSGYIELEIKTPTFNKLINETFWCNGTFPKLNTDHNDITLVNLNNCTLEITENQVINKQHDKNNFLLYKLDFDYDIKATAPQFQQYLQTVLPDIESQQVLQEFMGYIFIKQLKLEKFAILYGTGSNGKSVFFDIMMALLGETNVTNFSLKQLSEPYNQVMLGDKLLNYASELNGSIDSNDFKRLVSGEPIQPRPIYSKAVRLTNYAKFMFNANTLPQSVEHTHAYFRRFLIIHFDQVIDKNDADPNLAKRIIKNELAGIMNWIIVGIKRLQLNKSFSNCVKSDQILARYQQDSDPVTLFLEDNNYRTSSIHTVLLQILFERFNCFCSANNYTALSRTAFSRRLEYLGFIKKSGTGNKTVVFIEEVIT